MCCIRWRTRGSGSEEFLLGNFRPSSPRGVGWVAGYSCDWSPRDSQKKRPCLIVGEPEDLQASDPTKAMRHVALLPAKVRTAKPWGKSKDAADTEAGRGSPPPGPIQLRCRH